MQNKTRYREIIFKKPIDVITNIRYNVITKKVKRGEMMYVEKQKVIKVGNSVGVYLKRLSSAKWKPDQNEEVTVEYYKDKIVIRKVK